MKTSTLVGVGIGFLAGAFFTKQLQSRPITPEAALKLIKNKVSSKLSGSWIYTNKEQMNINDLKYNVYKGGFTRSTPAGDEHYLFTVDADTGSVLEISNTSI
ncbi:PepSY domain-containing protein [Pseudalkalibacillus sp. SCS-8]|uniref:PepSY domain-containing protein n=1 Tax=Pseudalkalibacillus nanhaiensis TaxID=3115291 RepID=UPI0032DB862C